MADAAALLIWTCLPLSSDSSSSSMGSGGELLLEVFASSLEESEREELRFLFKEIRGGMAAGSWG